MPIIKNKKKQTKKLKKALVVKSKTKKATNALAINIKLSAPKVRAVKKIKNAYEQMGKGLAEFIKIK